ncbi:hypothetical protein BC829DRAFT_147402 [Chytridium lagenaria]|nr:hypothetical protein BC829DRAFT_147402 [Chytridium lagenaria]
MDGWMDGMDKYSLDILVQMDQKAHTNIHLPLLDHLQETSRVACPLPQTLKNGRTKCVININSNNKTTKTTLHPSHPHDHQQVSTAVVHQATPSLLPQATQPPPPLWAHPETMSRMITTMPSTELCLILQRQTWIRWCQWCRIWGDGSLC